jgi:type II secretory pathway component PulF
MPIFIYKAQDANGKIIENEISVSGKRELIIKLKEQSLVPLEINEKKSEVHSGLTGKGFGNKKVTRKNITQFTSQLSALVNAKMNLAKALAALERQSANEKMKAIINSLLADVEKGKNLSDALEAYPQYFSSLYINMVRVGELGGVLDKALQRLVQMRVKDEELMGKIKGALAYPSIMALVMFGSIVVMLTFVIPKFSGVFTQMGTNLPFATRVVLAGSYFMEYWWWLVILVGVLVGLGVYALLRKEEYRLKFDTFKLKIPILGKIIQEICLSRFALSMGALLSSGVSIMKSLESTVPITGNLLIERALKQIAEEVRQGSSLSEAMRKRHLVFPALMTGMVGTGEDAGSLDEMLDNVGEYYRKESEDRINTLTTLLEPVMIVVMGSIVGFIISAILLPIFDVSTSIH